MDQPRIGVVTEGELKGEGDELSDIPAYELMVAAQHFIIGSSRSQTLGVGGSGPFNFPNLTRSRDILGGSIM